MTKTFVRMSKTGRYIINLKMFLHTHLRSFAGANELECPAGSMEQVQVSVLFFAKAREFVGKSEATVETVSVLSKEDFLKVLEAQFPDLVALQRCFVLSLNQEYLDDSALLHLASGDEIAVIPPISGG